MCTARRSRSALIAVAATALLSACASTGAVPRPFPLPGGAEPVPPAVSPAPGGSEIPGGTAGVPFTSTALALRGTPYRDGGATPDGFDCSGFVQYVFGRHGVALPRQTRDQFRQGRSVRREQLEPGDLVFFTTVAPGASHVGIALGGDQFVHAPSERGVVRVERLSVPYWSRRFIGARRLP